MPGGPPGMQRRQNTDPRVPPEHFADLLSTRAASGVIRETAEEDHCRFNFLVAKSYYNSEILVAFFVSEKLYHSFSKRCLDTITMFSAPEDLWGRYSVSFASQEVPRTSPEHSNTEYRRIPQPTGRIPVSLHLSQIQYIKNLE